MAAGTTATFRFPVLKVQLVAATRVWHNGGSEGFERLGIVILYEGTHEEHLGPRMSHFDTNKFDNLLEKVVLSDDGPNEIVFDRFVYPNNDEPRWELREVHLRRDTLLKT